MIMDHTREELDQLTAGYISDTMSFIHTVQEFCIIHSQWLLHRESELKRMRDITDRAEKINLTTDHILKSKTKMKAFGEYMWSKMTQVTAERRAQELEEELGCLLQHTLKGLEKLTPFLQAVEMLAVTSLSVFEEENPVCQLPEGVSADAVCSVITAARRACPLLIHFQTDAGELFLPSLVDVDLLAFQLDKYLRVSQELCEKLKISSRSIPFRGINYRAENASENDLCPNLTNEAIQNMFDHLTDLSRIRLDRHFRMAYLFRGSAQRFIGLFNQHRSRMQQFLEALEEEAVQLDRTETWTSSFCILGSVLGFVGGIFSIVSTMSIALLLKVGAWLGIFVALLSIATCITEFAVNTCHGKKINEIFKDYSVDMMIMVECLEKAASSITRYMVPDVLDVAPSILKEKAASSITRYMVPDLLDVAASILKATKMTYTLTKLIDAIADASTLMVGAEEVASGAVKVVTLEVKAARNITNMVANLTDIRQLAKGTPSTLSTCDLLWIIGSNAFCMGMDLFFICKEIKTLANQCKSDVSKVIRRRASLWKTELDALEKIHGSLCIGRSSFERSEEVLQRRTHSPKTCREELDQLAAGYISDTMSYIHTVQEFCIIHSQWLLHRESELKRMRDIRDREKKINLTTDHFLKSKTKMKAFGEYMWSKMTQVTAERRAQELEKELGCLLQDTLKGLEKLTLFLEAVEMLAVTSLSVFEEENPVCQLPEGVSADAVRSVITAARQACPLLIHFQRDAGKFFLPSLVNVDLLAFQLDKYLKVSQELCEKLQKSSGSISFLGINCRAEKASENDLCPNLTNEAIQNMYEHLTDLTSIRLDRHFRMTYLFRGSAQQFMDQFSQSCSWMQPFLKSLEEETVQLDRIKMRASIFCILGSVLGSVGGILSVVSVVSIVLLLKVGSWLGIAGAIISIVTCITESCVNTNHGEKIKKIFEHYSKDMETMLECLEKAASHITRDTVPDVAASVVTPTETTYTLTKLIDSITDAITLGVGAKDVASGTVKVVTQEVKAARNVPNMAANLTDIGQLAKCTPLALSKCYLLWIIGTNFFCMGMDLFFICKEIKTLANQCKSEVSKIICGKASLWKTELDAQEKIHGSLRIGISSFERSEEVLQRPFYT